MNFFHTHISEKSVELATETLRSTWVSEGKRVKEFEDALSADVGLTNPVAVNSGTSALHLALDIAGIGEGDEVILPPQTFVATGLVILMQRATPVFADIDRMTGNLSPDAFRCAITERTKAVMPVHWGGLPCDMDEINATARQHGIVVIEDAAHALGATYRGRPIGSISEYSAFSFQAIKHVTTGDGGAICCLNDDAHEKARVRRWFGIDRANSQPSVLGERLYDIDALGYKYHMNDLAATVGLGNLADFKGRLAQRRATAARLRAEFAALDGLELVRYDDDRESSYWFFTVLVEAREAFIRALHDKGVPSSIVHRRIDGNSVFGGIREELVGQNEFNEKQIALPVHEGLTDDDVETIIGAVKAGW